MLFRRTLIATSLLAVTALGLWAGRWWWMATNPRVPADAPRGWVPAVVVAAAGLSEPFGIAVAEDGAIYVAEGRAHAISRVSTDGTVQRVAGGRRGFADGAGAEAAFDTPSHLAMGPDGAVYLADTGNHAIRRISPDGVVTTVAGDGIAGNGDGSDGRLHGPVGVAVDRQGRIFATDSYNDRVVEVSGGTIRTIAGGSSPGLADGAASLAQFDTPSGMIALADGSLIVADTGNDAVRRISAGAMVSTIQTNDPIGGTDVLWRPIGVAAATEGRLYVTEARAHVTELIPDGPRRVLAGENPGFANGIGTSARLRQPAGIAVTPSGRIVVADSGNGLIRVLDLPSRLGAWPPAGPGFTAGFDRAGFARLPLVWPLDPQDGPHEIAGTMGEPRGNPGGDGRERFHAGVDVRADEGTDVRAVRDGTVSSVLASPFTGTLNEALAVGPITYVHIRVGRDRSDAPLVPWAIQVPDVLDPHRRPARVRVPRGTFIPAGQVIGTVNRFRHVHLNIGPQGEETNALAIGFPGVVDTVPPFIPAGGISVTDVLGQPLTERDHGRVIVRGPARIVVEAYDQMDDSPPRRRLGLHRIGFQVLTADHHPTTQFPEPYVAITFDALPSDRMAPPSLYAPGSGIPFYGTRVTRYRYLVTTRVEGERIVEAAWTPRLPPGDYVIRVLAEDAAGNRAVAGTDLPITIPDDDSPPGVATAGGPRAAPVAARGPG